MCPTGNGEACVTNLGGEARRERLIRSAAFWGIPTVALVVGVLLSIFPFRDLSGAVFGLSPLPGFVVSSLSRKCARLRFAALASRPT